MLKCIQQAARKKRKILWFDYSIKFVNQTARILIANNGEMSTMTGISNMEERVSVAVGMKSDSAESNMHKSGEK